MSGCTEVVVVKFLPCEFKIIEACCRGRSRSASDVVREMLHLVPEHDAVEFDIDAAARRTHLRLVV